MAIAAQTMIAEEVELENETAKMESSAVKSEVKAKTAGIKKYGRMLLFGIGSFILYGLLYIYSDELTRLAYAAHAGVKGLFFLPILIALLFSFVHGTFTSYFWDVLNVKAKK